MYEGVWLGDDVYNQYDDIYMEFDREGYWYLYIDGEMVDEGYLQYIPEWEGTYAEGVMESDIDGDGETDVRGSFVYASGDSTWLVWIWDPEERYVFREDLSVLTTNSGDISEYVGLWEYVDEDVWISIYEDETWECFDAQGNAFQSGTLSVDSTGITFYMDESDEALRFERTENDDLVDSENDGMLVPADSMPGVPYFTRYGLEINAAMDNGTYLLEDGVCSYVSNNGNGYSTGDCYWEVIKNYDETHDGIREIQFDAICYILQSSLGSFDQQYMTALSFELYDFYSGKWFTAANTVGDYAKVVTMSYVVYLPEGYDGLVFAAEVMQDNYEDFAKDMQLDGISYDVSIMDIDLSDTYRCLFFSISD